MTQRVRRVAATLGIRVREAGSIELQIAVDDSVIVVDERLTITCDGRPVEPSELRVLGNARVHLLAPPPGEVEVSYSADVFGEAAQPAVSDVDRVVYRRPSRYAESDRLVETARAEFRGVAPDQLAAAVSSWVGDRLSYVPGSSLPTDGAVDSLLKREGVCRDYAHLVVALVRALDVPARVAAVYAPGLQPMDFHAVAEVAVGDTWQVVDATRLAPRSSLVRIATGRDAADTAFMTTYGGSIELVSTQVRATIDGPLPLDDLTAPARIG